MEKMNFVLKDNLKVISRSIALENNPWLKDFKGKKPRPFLFFYNVTHLIPLFAALKESGFVTQ